MHDWLDDKRYHPIPLCVCRVAVHTGYEVAGNLHILCAYWGFVLMAVHLGLHWNGILLMAGKRFKPSRMRRNTLRILAFCSCGLWRHCFHS